MAISFGVTVLPDPPFPRFLELLTLAEQQGFEYGWTYDSHLLWQEPYPFLTAAALATERIKRGLSAAVRGAGKRNIGELVGSRTDDWAARRISLR